MVRYRLGGRAYPIVHAGSFRTQAETRKAGTLKQYVQVFRSLPDHAGVEPNPARDPRVKLPKQVREEANPPPADHFLAILETLLPKWRLFFVTLEQGATSHRRGRQPPLGRR